jgi:hypothetical protein
MRRVWLKRRTSIIRRDVWGFPNATRCIEQRAMERLQWIRDSHCVQLEMAWLPSPRAIYVAWVLKPCLDCNKELGRVSSPTACTGGHTYRKRVPSAE